MKVSFTKQHHIETRHASFFCLGSLSLQIVSSPKALHVHRGTRANGKRPGCDAYRSTYATNCLMFGTISRQGCTSQKETLRFLTSRSVGVRVDVVGQELTAATGGVNGRSRFVRGVDHAVRHLDERVQVKARLATPHDVVARDLYQQGAPCDIEKVLGGYVWCEAGS